jgi:hypothetical protein
MPTMKFMLKSFFLLVAAFCCAERLAYGQGVDAVVEIPTTAHKSALIEIPTARQNVADANTDNSVTMAGEYKSTKNVIEEQKPTCWDWVVDFGYVSEYNFRGTNLTPGTNAGAISLNAEVSKWNFTLGVFGIRQLGKAQADGWATGESGGGGAAHHVPGFLTQLVDLVPETTQSTLEEIDVFLNYHWSIFGWVDLTIGDVAFFIHRKAETDVTLIFAPTGQRIFEFPAPTIGDEQFNRLLARLSTSKIPYVTPSVTYYQTIYNDGQDRPALAFFGFGPLHRNDSRGGYFEGQLRGNFPVTDRVSVNPYGKVSYSYRDRTEPISNPQNLREAVRGQSLKGWNVAQAGLELPIRLVQFVGSSSGPCAPPDVAVYLVPSGWYSYHISDPTPGTDREEAWGGVKLTVTF